MEKIKRNLMIFLYIQTKLKYKNWRQGYSRKVYIICYRSEEPCAKIKSHTTNNVKQGYPHNFKISKLHAWHYGITDNLICLITNSENHICSLTQFITSQSCADSGKEHTK